jgi:hypothetical protein
MMIGRGEQRCSILKLLGRYFGGELRIADSKFFLNTLFIFRLAEHWFCFISAGLKNTAHLFVFFRPVPRLLKAEGGRLKAEWEAGGCGQSVRWGRVVAPWLAGGTPAIPVRCAEWGCWGGCSGRTFGWLGWLENVGAFGFAREVD